MVQAEKEIFGMSENLKDSEMLGIDSEWRPWITNSDVRNPPAILFSLNSKQIKGVFSRPKSFG